jgi:phytoene dehydrogenase-like protein
MPSPIIIGAGHNGLVTAFYLAKAGHKPIVLERRSVPGGCAVTGEIAAGFRCPTLAHNTGPLRRSIVRDMQIARRVEFVEADPRLVALGPDGTALTFFRDRARTVEAIRGISETDATAYAAFCETLETLAKFLAPMLEITPPSLDDPTGGELWDLLKTGRRFRALGRSNGYRLLRWLPMPAADLVGEYFSNELLQAAVASRGIFGTSAGPWSAGTGAVLLLNAAVDALPGGGSVTVKGGPGALTKALAAAAREAGAEIRLGNGVSRILVKDGAARGVVLDDGTALNATAVISNAHPKRTLLELVDPEELEPVFLNRLRNYRSTGSLAKVNFALDALPTFAGLSSPGDLHGRILVGPSVDYIERAFDHSKYGEISSEPYLELTVPSLADPSLAPPGRHVMSVYVQFAPYRLAHGDWDAKRGALADIVLRTLERYSPGISETVEHRQVITPVDLEQEFGLTGGHIFHGEPALDQLFSMRPILGWAQYRTPVARLYLCGAGTHPGGGITGGPGQNAAHEILKDLKR